MKHQNRIILGAVFGNLIEAFDMAICGLLSLYLARYLIGDNHHGLMLIFVTFFAGYLARPIGAFILGLFSDVYGRKITLAASIIAMGIATAAIGLIPSYQSIGIHSMIILVILRIIQSFSCGVEFLNSSAYLVENADLNHKGFAGSWASFGSAGGLLLASIVTFGVSLMCVQFPEYEWLIWRIPFILALLGSSIGLYIRLFLPESLEYIVYYADHPKPEIGKLFRQALRYCFKNKIKSIHVFILSSLGVTTTFLFYIYGPTQAHLYGNFTDNQILMANMMSLMLLMSVYPLAGYLADKINPSKLVITAAFGFVSLAQLFFFTLSGKSYFNFFVLQCLISIPCGIYYAIVPVLLTNMFPINLRCTVLSAIYSVAASLSAGMTPILSLYLLQKTHNPSAPGMLVVSLVLLMLISMVLRVRERKVNLQRCEQQNSYA
ncbi:MFS transporter [bacterium]|nr:MFS transporter [bacterium]